MKTYKPVTHNFSEGVPIVETTDTNHADNINAAPKSLIENDLYLIEMIEDLGLSVEDGVLCQTFDE